MTAIAPLYVYAYTASAHLFIHDEEAADFLQSQFSNDLRPMEVGSCTYGLWLNAKGRVLGDSWLLCDGDNQYRLLSYSTPQKVIQSTLEQHIVADDVEIDAQPSASMLCVSGKEADACLQSILGQPMPKTDRKCVQLGPYTIFQARRSYLGAYEVLCRTPADADKLVQQLQQASAQVLDEVGMHLFRLQSGCPLVPQEVGANDFPAEAGFEADALSFTKGCFIGQEVVVRMHNLGRARRALCLVHASGAMPAIDADIVNEAGRTLGQLRSCYPCAHGWVGAAMIQQKAIAAAMTLHINEVHLTVLGSLRSGASNPFSAAIGR